VGRLFASVVTLAALAVGAAWLAGWRPQLAAIGQRSGAPDAPVPTDERIADEERRALERVLREQGAGSRE
jgi:hypothetical protein